MASKPTENIVFFPLPEKEVPNNRNQVLQRASWLKKRLLNNLQMFEDYKKFMENILDKGYAKVAEKPPKPNQTWYIPHHGVTILKKQTKSEWCSTAAQSTTTTA